MEQEVNQELETKSEDVKEAVVEAVQDASATVEPVVEAVDEAAAPAEPVGDAVSGTPGEGNGNEEEDGGPKVKTQFTGKVVKMSLAAALVDIGLDIPSVIHITQIPRPEGDNAPKNLSDLLTVGQEITVWVRRVKDNRVELTMIKPFDLEWREIKKDMVVKGSVVRMEPFGVFVEIGAERPGLVHISELAHNYVKQPSDVLSIGQEIEAQVLEVNRRKKQIKLSMKALLPAPEASEHVSYGRNVEKLGDIDLSEVGGTVVPRPLSARAQQLKAANFAGDNAYQGDRTRKPKRTSRKRAELNSEGIDLMFSSTAEGEIEQTAMEIALREAMEKAKSRNKTDRKKSGISSEQADILARTLNTKAG